MIDLQNVSKSYAGGSVRAVDNLSLRVEPGEIFGFLGPNGAGKTTTIKIMTGLLNADAGSVRIKGFDIAKEALKAKANIGYVPDNADVYERLKGIEYLNFMADVYNVSQMERSERLEKYLTMFDLKDAAFDLIKSYSHGMRQKIVITGALLHSPSVWILDEPMVGLDPKSAHLLKEEMKEHCSKGNTVFFSTHILEVAEKLCNRIGIIHKGKLIATGTLEELRKTEGDQSLENIFLELTQI